MFWLGHSAPLYAGTFHSHAKTSPHFCNLDLCCANASVCQQTKKTMKRIVQNTVETQSVKTISVENQDRDIRTFPKTWLVLGKASEKQ
jgi:hypothetical protein